MRGSAREFAPRTRKPPQHERESRTGLASPPASDKILPHPSLLAKASRDSLGQPGARYLSAGLRAGTNGERPAGARPLEPSAGEHAPAVMAIS